MIGKKKINIIIASSFLLAGCETAEKTAGYLVAAGEVASIPDFERSGVVSIFKEHDKTSATLTLGDGSVWELDQWPLLLSPGESVSVYRSQKNKGRYWVRKLDEKPKTSEVFRGKVERVENKPNSTVIYASDQRSFEVQSAPEILPGSFVSIVKSTSGYTARFVQPYERQQSR